MVAGYSPAYIYLYETYSGVRIWALKPAVRDSMKEIDLRHDTEGKFSMDIGYGVLACYARRCRLPSSLTQVGR
jgi:hypothetical protein